MKKHYVYRITNTILNKHYYGVRSSKIEPELDLGFKYFSSSTDKEFIQDQKVNPKNFNYKVLRIFETREEAAQLEIKLHKKFNVGVNEKFYNKAIQTSAGFDITGTTHSVSLATRRKISVAFTGKLKSIEHKAKLSAAHIGRVRSAEHSANISASLKGKQKSAKHIASIRKPCSDETKAKISATLRGNPLSVEHRVKLSEAKKGTHLSVETKTKTSQALTGTKNPNFGKIWIFNLLRQESKMIKKENFPYYEDLGWIKCRKIK